MTLNYFPIQCSFPAKLQLVKINHTRFMPGCDVSVMQLSVYAFRKREAVFKSIPSSILTEKRTILILKQKTCIFACYAISEKPFFICSFCTRPGHFTFPQNHKLCTQDYSPEDANFENCVYENLCTIKKKPTSDVLSAGVRVRKELWMAFVPKKQHKKTEPDLSIC